MTQPDDPQGTKTAAKNPEEIGDIQVAEYLIFLFALDTYIKWLETVHGSQEGTDDPDYDEPMPADDVTKDGLALLKKIDGKFKESVVKFVLGKLPAEPQKKMFSKGMERPGRTPSGVLYRSDRCKRALERGGAKTLMSLFENRRATGLVRLAMASSDTDPGAEAMQKFAACTVRNPKIRAWIKKAAEVVVETAGPVGEVQMIPQSIVSNAASEAADSLRDLRVQQQVAAGSRNDEEVLNVQEHRQELLESIQAEATEHAAQAMAARGEADTVPTKSEVVGIATAVAAAVASDSADPSAVPAVLKAALRDDEEQIAAAMTDGRVIVAAGAGSGKSKTAVARVEYLIKERGVAPQSIIMSTFNREAADSLKQRVAQECGSDVAEQMDENIETMHTLFKNQIIKLYGTPEQKAAVSAGNIGAGGAVTSKVNDLWRKCNRQMDPETGEMKPGKAPKRVRQYVTYWKANGIPPAEAQADAKLQEEVDAAKWYEWYEGMKGNIPGWDFRSICTDKQALANYQQFMDRKRQGGRLRLADFDDWLVIARDIMQDPEVRKKVQAGLKHVIVDECQDLSGVQADVFEAMTEHITDGQDGTSFWMVGDDKQAIYEWRGADPKRFQSKVDDPTVASRGITTNYRCPPAVVESANRLISHNDDQIPFSAKPSPGRNPNDGSMTIEHGGTTQEVARRALRAIRGRLHQEAIDNDGRQSFEDHAVLARTNRELDVYETVCLMNGIPYVRKGAKANFGTPEMKSLLGAMDIIKSEDPKASQEALLGLLEKPRKFYLPDGATKSLIQPAITAAARRAGKSADEMHMRDLIQDPKFQDVLAERISGQEKKPLARDPKYRTRWEKAWRSIQMMAEDLQELEATMDNPDSTMTDVIDTFLDFRGVQLDADPDNPRYNREHVVTFREQLQQAYEDRKPDDDEGGAEDDEKILEGDLDPEAVKDPRQNPALGSFSFIFDLMERNPDDPNDEEFDPAVPENFLAKVGRIKEKADDLAIDLNQWKRENKAALKRDPDLKPPGVYLGTAHSTKGAQWRNTYLLASSKKFPLPFPIPKELKLLFKMQPELAALTPRQLYEQGIISEMLMKQWENHSSAERRLGYVAVTRTKKNMMILSPDTREDGTPDGISPFVSEMGASLGENINPEGVVDPDVRTASFDDPPLFEEPPADYLEPNFEPFQASEEEN